MIVNRIDQLTKKIEDLNSVKELASQTKNFSQRRDELNEISLVIKQLMEIVLLFREMGFDIDVREKNQTFIKSFIIMKDSWVKDKNSIITQNQFTIRNNIKSIYNEISKELFTLWKNFLDEKKPNLNFEQLNILEKMPGLEIKVIELKDCLEKINKFKESLPTKSEDLNLVLSISNDMVELWSQLSSNEIPTKVLNFLKKAGSHEGIKLSEIDSDIFFWLNEKNLTQLCQVRFK
jgi:hypothetical protein